MSLILMPVKELEPSTRSGGDAVRSSKWMLIGASAVAAGVLMVGMAYVTSGVVDAGNAIPCDFTPVIPTATPPTVVVGADSVAAGPNVVIASVRQECTETPTPPQRLKTHTPTPTDTETPKTNTPVPTSTQPPPTNTPKAASEAVSVKPPNTGSGTGGSGSMTLWLLALGTAAVALGGGTVFVGVRRR
jgi:hypothetical protein